MKLTIEIQKPLKVDNSTWNRSQESKGKPAENSKKK